MSIIHAARGLSFNPLYKEVKNRIIQNLIAGKWRPGEAIPSEAKLAARFGASIGTVRKAIDELVLERVLIRQQGKGTFVAFHTEDRTLYYFFHIVGQDGKKEFPASELLSFRGGKADPETAARLEIDQGDPVFTICNLLKLRGKPKILDNIIVPRKLFPGLDKKIFRNRESTIYGLYQSRYGINVIRTVERLRASLCDSVCAKALQLTPKSPVLEIYRTAYTYNNMPVELRVSRVNTERHDYLSDLG